MSESIQQSERPLPSATRLEPLLAKAQDLARGAIQLAGQSVAPELRTLLRGMNAYYTGRIEGLPIRPREIEQALRKEFSDDAKVAARQRLVLAHVETEAAIEQRYVGNDGARRLFDTEAVQDLHRELFTRLPAQDLVTAAGLAIVPGQLRTQDVQVGRHAAPPHANLETLLTRWASFHGGVRKGDASLVALAAAHQRLGWIHPFIDGNGPVVRLHTHGVLNALGYTNGLLSPTRGFARSTERYYALRADADSLRRGDAEAGGNPNSNLAGTLSEQAWGAWVDYVLEVCIEQVRFMKSALDLAEMERRIAACLAFEETTMKSGVRREALRPLHYLFLTGGQMERGEFKSMTGLGDRTAVSLLTALVKRGLLRSNTPQGKVRFGLPLHALRFYFPALWPEAEAEAGHG